MHPPHAVAMRPTARLIMGSVVAALALSGLLPEALAARGAPDVPRIEHDPALTLARAGLFNESGYQSGRAGFTVLVGDIAVSHQVFAIPSLPGEVIRIRVESPDALDSFVLRHASGEAAGMAGAGWDWTAPTSPGLYPLRVERADGSFIHLNVLVMHERNRVVDGALNGYAIGSYREEPLRGDPVYLPPIGFVETMASNEDVLVSPHFTLGQFLCKQPGAPRYLALSVPLVQKLEEVLAAVNAAGIHAPSLHVMSGFRTPAYNAAIGNTTVYSRHLWGDAADIYVDADRDQQMDDLNGDGASDVDDARLLFEIVDTLERQDVAPIRDGGLGLYRRNAAHGPFVHVDARGQAARW